MHFTKVTVQATLIAAVTATAIPEEPKEQGDPRDVKDVFGKVVAKIADLVNPKSYGKPEHDKEDTVTTQELKKKSFEEGSPVLRQDIDWAAREDSTSTRPTCYPHCGYAPRVTGTPTDGTRRVEDVLNCPEKFRGRTDLNCGVYYHRTAAPEPKWTGTGNPMTIPLCPFVYRTRYPHNQTCEIYIRTAAPEQATSASVTVIPPCKSGCAIVQLGAYKPDQAAAAPPEEKRQNVGIIPAINVLPPAVEARPTVNPETPAIAKPAILPPDLDTPEMTAPVAKPYWMPVLDLDRDVPETTALGKPIYQVPETLETLLRPIPTEPEATPTETLPADYFGGLDDNYTHNLVFLDEGEQSGEDNGLDSGVDQVTVLIYRSVVIVGAAALLLAYL